MPHDAIEDQGAQHDLTIAKHLGPVVARNVWGSTDPGTLAKPL